MAIINAYGKFKIEWDDEVTLPRMIVEQYKSTGCILDDFFNQSHISAYHEIPWCCLDGNKDYSFEYERSGRKLALIRLDICVQADPNYGSIITTFESDDSLFCKTDHDGTFEFFVFNNMKAKSCELFDMLVSGRLDAEIQHFLNS